MKVNNEIRQPKYIVMKLKRTLRVRTEAVNINV